MYLIMYVRCCRTVKLHEPSLQRTTARTPYDTSKSLCLGVLKCHKQRSKCEQSCEFDVCRPPSFEGSIFGRLRCVFFLDDALSWQTSYILPCAKSEGF